MTEYSEKKSCLVVESVYNAKTSKVEAIAALLKHLAAARHDDKERHES